MASSVISSIAASLLVPSSGDLWKFSWKASFQLDFAITVFDSVDSNLNQIGSSSLSWPVDNISGALHNQIITSRSNTIVAMVASLYTEPKSKRRWSRLRMPALWTSKSIYLILRQICIGLVYRDGAVTKCFQQDRQNTQLIPRFQSLS